jgi:glycosyltransferase involved in cell wall biosynthesis
MANIGFISTRFAGQDGVSLESAKWAEVLWEDWGHVNYWYSGRNDRHPDFSFCVPEAHFGFPENEWINQRIWGTHTRSRLVSDRIQEMVRYLKSTLYQFVEKYNIDLVIPQNVSAIPMHVPLGIALTEFLMETGIPAISHHHDFYWERVRFSIGGVLDYLDMAFPPKLPNVQDVVINRAAQEQLAHRKGISSTLIPNVFRFEKPPPKVDSYSADLRKELGLAEDDYMILQPTRVVPRKGIEHSIKILSKLKEPRCKLVVSHEAGDEGVEYQELLADLAADEGVEMLFVSDRVGEVRQRDHEGRKIYTLWDMYAHSDLVTYPSLYEGFGNALLESIYFKMPVIVNRYSILVQDIEPKGFNFLSMDGFVTKELVREVGRVLEDDKYRQEMVDHNYHVASQYYGYTMLSDQLRALQRSLIGEKGFLID